MGRRTRFTINEQIVDVSHVPVKSSFEDFVMINQQTFHYCAQDVALPIIMRVQNFILSRIGRQNSLLGITPTVISKELGISRSSASRSLSYLVNIRMLKKVSNQYVFSPEWAWKGSQEEHKKELQLSRSVDSKTSVSKKNEIVLPENGNSQLFP